MNATPVFVWRTSSYTTTQGPHCRHCNFYISGAAPSSMTGEQEKHLDVFKAAASKYVGDPYWDQYESTGRGASFEWNAYQLLCPRCGWWASGVTNFNGEKF